MKGFEEEMKGRKGEKRVGGGGDCLNMGTVRVLCLVRRQPRSTVNHPIHFK